MFVIKLTGSSDVISSRHVRGGCSLQHLHFVSWRTIVQQTLKYWQAHVLASFELNKWSAAAAVERRTFPPPGHPTDLNLTLTGGRCPWGKCSGTELCTEVRPDRSAIQWESKKITPPPRFSENISPTTENF